MDWTTLPERQRQQQNAIWELVQTEVAYLRTLKVITDVSLIRSIARSLSVYELFVVFEWCENIVIVRSFLESILNTASANSQAGFSRYWFIVILWASECFMYIIRYIWLSFFSCSWPVCATSKQPRSSTRSTLSASFPICQRFMWRIGNFGPSMFSPCSRMHETPELHLIPLPFGTDS